MTEIRPEISLKSPYHISKHRYLELKHFCLQYPEWKQEINKLNYFGVSGDIKSYDISKPTERLATLRQSYSQRIEMVEQVCLSADGDIYTWLLRSVTLGVPYAALRMNDIPCSRDYFYTRYRRFFWLLDKIRE